MSKSHVCLLKTFNKNISLTKSKMKSYALFEECEVSLRTMKPLIKKVGIYRNSAMSTKTKDFIQKICYKKTASIDMTRYGFINDSKLNPVNLMMKPLRAQLEKICGKVKMNRSIVGPSTRSSHSSPPEQKLESPPLINPEIHSPRTHVRKVRIQIDQSPTIRKKKGQAIVTRIKGQEKLTRSS